MFCRFVYIRLEKTKLPIIFHHSLLGLICVPSLMCLFRESKLLASAIFLLEKKEKFTLRTAKAEGTLFLCLGAKKT
jgi:hypothetical protein